MAKDIYGTTIVNSIADLNVRWHLGGPPGRAASVAIEEVDTGRTVLALDLATARALATRLLEEIRACEGELARMGTVSNPRPQE